MIRRGQPTGRNDSGPRRDPAKRGPRRGLGVLLGLGLLAAALSMPQGGSAQTGSPPPRPDHADFRVEPSSRDAREVADWVVRSADNTGMPFVIIDKINAKVFVFRPDGRLRGAAPALLGLARGDDSVAGVGHRKLAAIGVSERTTPAGRFIASLGHDFEQDILWVDYDSALSLHRVITGRPQDHRRQRLATPTPLDNRISYGCINVPPAFYDTVVAPAFAGTRGVVYILPETRSIQVEFPMAAASRQTVAASLPRGSGLASP